MNVFPYLSSPEKLAAFFDAIRREGVPKKFTYRYFSKIGFPSSSDRPFVTLLRSLAFIDDKGVPQGAYYSLRDSSLFEKTLEEKVVFLYKELFDIEEHPQFVPENVLIGYFSRFSSFPENVLILQAKTFKELCILSGMGVEKDGIAEKLVSKEDNLVNKERRRPRVNVSINLPTTTDEKVYESLFRHLRDLLNP